jgi:hypothetical protein
MKLTNENYYGKEANQEYLSVSQYKDFFGSLGKKGCESKALARIAGEYKSEPTTSMLVGSYIDTYFEGTLDNFKAEHPEILKKDGTLKADYVQAESIIARIEKDKKFMQYMSGEKQTIMTADLFGAHWKIKMDSYLKDKAIVDLKIVSDIYERNYVKDVGALNFIQYWGYDLQLAIYQKVVEENTGKQLPCFIAVADKGKTTNIEIIQITQPELDSALIGVQYGVERILKLKSGEEKPERCGRCDYCKETKVIQKPILMSELLEN